MMHDFFVRMRPVWIKTMRQGRRAAVAVVGFTLLAGGIVMLVTPGPGWLAIFLGLSVLSAQYGWARRLLNRLKDKGAQLSNAVFGTSRKQAC
jgi:uncharacterized protein (TIGR02611 family)